MIQITKLSRLMCTGSVTVELTKEEEKSLAGDIENWLMSKKSIICNKEVKNEKECCK